MNQAKRIVPDNEICPRLAAMQEFYALLIACVRNEGKRTCHTFRCDDATLLTMIQAAAAEGFQAQAGAYSESQKTITVWKR